MRIFSLKEYEENKFPKPEDFKQTLDDFEDECVLPFIGNKVRGGFGYGSVKRDDCNIASDIDYLMITEDDSHSKKIKSATYRAQLKNIQIQVRAISLEEALSGFHGIDPSFKQHLEHSQKKYGHHGENPLQILSDNGTPFELALKQSMALYLRRLRNSLTNYPLTNSEKLNGLKAILEKPQHAMRVAIQYRTGNVGPKEENFEDTKGHLLKIYKKLRFPKELIQDIEEINRVSKKYIGTLESKKRIYDGSEDPTKYLQMLEEIEATHKTAYRFILGNAKLMAS